MSSDRSPDSDRGCPKCGHEEAAVGDVAVSSKGVEMMMDWEDRYFRVIYCTECGYAEHYVTNADKDELADLFFE